MEKITKHFSSSVGEVFISYRRGTETVEPTVIFLHGWGSNHEVWSRQLAACSRPTMAIDLPGFGKSGVPSESLTVDGYADVISEIIDQAQLHQVVLVGHSFGGQIATALAAQEPDWLAGLVLVDSASLRSKQPPLLSRIGSLLSPLFKLPGLKNLRPLLYTLVGADEPPENEVMKSTMRNVLREDQSEKLISITAPTQIIWGSRDEATPLEHGELLTRAIPQSNIVVLDGGHFIFLDQPTRFNDTLMSFINNLQ